MFGFSILYVFALFAARLAEASGAAQLDLREEKFEGAVLILSGDVPLLRVASLAALARAFE